MSRARALWFAVAVVEALLIVLLALQLSGRSAVAGAAGAAAGAGADDGRGDVRVERPDAADDVAADDSAASSPPAAGPAAAAPTRPPLGALVYGGVRRADGEGLGRHIRVVLQQPSGERLRSTSLDEQTPRFAWPDVPPGDYELRAAGSGVREFVRAVTVPPGEGAHRVDVELVATWSVEVRLVTPAGRPLSAALADLRAARPGFESFDAVHVIALWSDPPPELPATSLRRSPFSVARWVVNRGRGGAQPGAVEPAGVLELPEDRPAFVAAVLRHVVLDEAPIEPGQRAVELVVDPGRLAANLSSVRLQVVGADGAPARDAKVGISDSQSFRPPQPVDEEGRWQQRDLLPGRYRLFVQAEGAGLPATTLELLPGTDLDLGALRLRPSRELVVEVRGKGDGEVRCECIPLDGLDVPGGSPRAEVLALQEGLLRGTLAEGRYLLRLSGAGGAMVTVDTRTLGDRPLVVDLAPEAELRFDSSGLTDPLRCALRTPRGVEVYRRWVYWKGTWKRSLLPGTYHLTIEPLGGAPRTETVVVPPEGTTITF